MGRRKLDLLGAGCLPPLQLSTRLQGSGHLPLLFLLLLNQ